MPRDRISTSIPRSRRSRALLSAGSAVGASLLFVLAVGAAARSAGWEAGLAWLGAGGMLAVAVASLQRALQSLWSPSPASFRSAFGAGAVFGAVVVAGSGSTPTHAGLGMLGAAMASFVGGLAASTVEFGLWEDNQPPKRDLLDRVVKAHTVRIGDEPRLPPGKVLLDRLGAAVGLLITLPLGLVVLMALWLEDPGPLFFVKNSVGRGGRNFRQWKIRTMVRGAESESGPVLSEREDPRVLRVGRWLRRTALDELPQLVNILAGQMSLVGPRPQRTVLVAEYLEVLPEYAERHRLPPGLAGLAQVAGHYYLTPRQKLRFDRLYLRHAGLGFDLRLILIALGVVFWLRWKPGWDGRLPRAWLRRRSR